MNYIEIQFRYMNACISECVFTSTNQKEMKKMTEQLMVDLMKFMPLMMKFQNSKNADELKKNMKELEKPIKVLSDFFQNTKKLQKKSVKYDDKALKCLKSKCSQQTIRELKENLIIQIIGLHILSNKSIQEHLKKNISKYLSTDVKELYENFDKICKI